MPKEVNILIVDDDLGTRETLRDILQEKGYKVESAKNGEECLEKIKKKFFDVALIDIKLPDYSGTEILKKVRDKQPDAVVIIITAYASIQTSVEALNEGAYAYIMKPLNIDEVVANIREGLKKQQLIIENRRLKEFNENIVQSMTDGLLIEDSNGIITFVNPKTEHIIGYSKDELIGKHSKDIFAPEHVKKMKDVREKRLKEITNNYESVVVSKGGRKIHIILSTTPITDSGGNKRVLSVFTDITQRKKAEGELNKKVEELERFSKLAVGRELKMVELKKRIKDLGRKLEDGGSS